MPKINRLLAAASLAIASSASASSFADVVVVVSAKSNVSGLSTSQIAKIFLSKINTFPNGSKAEPLDQAVGSAIRNEFYSKVTGKDSSQVNAYWSKVIFAGDGQPPSIVTGNEGVKRAVADNPNAIGYIDNSAVDDTVKVILSP
jgi:ABC-type phosphate transport system substrate-binding protein